MIKPYSENREQAGELATYSVGGIIACDVFILFAHQDGTGVFTEFGAHLPSRSCTGNQSSSLWAMKEPNRL